MQIPSLQQAGIEIDNFASCLLLHIYFLCIHTFYKYTCILFYKIAKIGSVIGLITFCGWLKTNLKGLQESNFKCERERKRALQEKGASEKHFSWPCKWHSGRYPEAVEICQRGKSKPENLCIERRQVQRTKRTRPDSKSQENAGMCLSKSVCAGMCMCVHVFLCLTFSLQLNCYQLVF